jgi:hypothetical protein
MATPGVSAENQALLDQVKQMNQEQNAFMVALKKEEAINSMQSSATNQQLSIIKAKRVHA